MLSLSLLPCGALVQHIKAKNNDYANNHKQCVYIVQVIYPHMCGSNLSFVHFFILKIPEFAVTDQQQFSDSLNLFSKLLNFVFIY